MFKLTALALLLSFDALSFGLSFGIKGIALPLKAVFIICASGFAVTLGAVRIGEIMYNILPFGRAVGGVVLIAMGIYLALDIKGRNSLKSILSAPEKTDMNKSGAIEAGEALAIGTALSLDSCAVVIGTSYLGIMLPVAIMIFQVIFLFAGIEAGRKISLHFSGKYASLISGVIIVIMGFAQLKG